ncbi:MAG: IclR family transcriptional regulator [Actinomycetes bacterium]
MSAPTGPAQSVQSVDRAMTLLAAVASSDHPAPVAELALRCGLNRSTAWRLLATLEAHGMVERDHSGGFLVGYGAFRLGAAADLDALVRRVRPELERLSARVGETVSLAVVKSLSLVYVDHVAVNGVAFHPWTQDRVSLHSTSSGKIFLAWLTDQEREGAIPRTLERFTDRTIVDRSVLDADLERARQRGYAECAGEDAAFTNGVSAAALDARRRPIAVVNVWGPERRIPVARFDDLGGAVTAAASRVAALLS